MRLDDQATEAEERDRERALLMRKPVLSRTGRCYNCENPVEELYCDVDCRDDFEKRQRCNR